MAKKLAWEVEQGNVLFIPGLDPSEIFVVDYVQFDEDNSLVKVEGYTKAEGTEVSFIWGSEKVVNTV